MANIELAIKIDEDIAQAIIDGENDEPRNIVRSFQATIADAIKNGTIFPESHGRLIDISPYEQWFNPVVQYDDGDHIYQVYTKNIPTVIEADRENVIPLPLFPTKNK